MAVSLRVHGVAVALAFCLPACGGSSPEQPAPGPPGTGTDGTITGRERIGWTQPSDATQMATLDFAVYVDGARRALPGDTCAPTGPATFECSAPLPSLTPGEHTLELVSFTIENGITVESGRSTPLRVTVAAVTAPAPATPSGDTSLVTPEGHRLQASVVASGLDDPTDLAILPDGRVLVAERAGRVRIVTEAGVIERPALELDDVAEPEESGLTTIALHPDFERNGQVYVGYTVEGREGLAIRVARLRERGGVLAQAATIARERAPAAQAHVTARFGSDGRLYLGLGAGPDPRDAQDAASPLGKILRLNDDGSTPRDNPRGGTTFSSGHRDPRALAWHPRTGVLWELERDRESGDELNAIVAGGDYGWPLARGAGSTATSVPAALVLPAGTDVSGAAFVPSNARSPMAGELLVASRGAEDLIRIRLVGNERPESAIGGLFQRRFGRIAAVGVSTEGAVYAATGNRESWGPSSDVLIRISPVAAN